MSRTTCWLALTLLASSILQVACFKEPEESKKQAESKKIKVVAVFATEIKESWDGAIHQALSKLRADGVIDYDYTDKVGPNEFRRTLEEKAKGDADIIMGDAFASEATVREVALEYPQKAFVFGSGLGPTAPNLSVFDNWIHEPAYLAGMVAGRLTKDQYNRRGCRRRHPGN